MVYWDMFHFILMGQNPLRQKTNEHDMAAALPGAFPPDCLDLAQPHAHLLAEPSPWVRRECSWEGGLPPKAFA